jgi:hypothetical protein
LIDRRFLHLIEGETGAHAVEQIVVILAIVMLPLARHGERGRRACAGGIRRRDGRIRRGRGHRYHDVIALGGGGRLMRAGTEQEQSADDQTMSSDCHALNPLAELILPGAQHAQHRGGFPEGMAGMDLGGPDHGRFVAAQEGIDLNLQRERRG